MFVLYVLHPLNSEMNTCSLYEMNVDFCILKLSFTALAFKGLGRAVAYWLKHYATNRQVAGSIPDGVTGIFQ
jgi:hypothetical protein